jgi:hypothetical protein
LRLFFVIVVSWWRKTGVEGRSHRVAGTAYGSHFTRPSHATRARARSTAATVTGDSSTPAGRIRLGSTAACTTRTTGAG